MTSAGNCIISGCPKTKNLNTHHTQPRLLSKTKRNNTHKVLICKNHHKLIHWVFDNRELNALALEGITPGFTAFDLKFKGRLQERLESKDRAPNGLKKSIRVILSYEEEKE